MDWQGKEGKSLQSWISSLPAKGTYHILMVEFGFLGTLVQSGSFQRTTAAVFLTPEHSQTVHHGGSSQAVGTNIPGRSWARIQSPAAK